jgi:hypothetical protein
MFFDNYKQHKNAAIRKTLFWEYDFEKIDWQKMRNLVVQRVIERGRIDDFYAILNLYGLEGVVAEIKRIPYLNAKDQAFVCSVFNINRKELKCCSKKQSRNPHWTS